MIRSLQRLFSAFPDGWPGLGLLLQRFGAAIALIYFGIAGLDAALGIIPLDVSDGTWTGRRTNRI
jgi:hypothetical protein